MSKADRERHHQTVLDMLTFHGIDASKVMQEGVSEEGYYTLEKTNRGEVFADGFWFDFHAWPKSFPVAPFFEQYWAWKKAVV